MPSDRITRVRPYSSGLTTPVLDTRAITCCGAAFPDCSLALLLMLIKGPGLLPVRSRRYWGISFDFFFLEV